MNPLPFSTIKQFFSKLPLKSLKSDSAAEPPQCGGGAVNANDGLSARPSPAKLMSSHIFPATMIPGIDPLIPFKDVPSSERMDLFVSKLNLCSMVFDFNDHCKNSVEKDLKRQTLIEILDFSTSCSSKYPEPAIMAMCNMCAINLFRVFPSNYRSYSSCVEDDDCSPVFYPSPAWTHLQIVHSLLLKFITSSNLEARIAKRYVDHLFILRLLELFDCEDPRERDCLKTLMHRIYGKFMVHRPFIRKAISNIFFRFVLETEQHNGIAALLDIFSSIISGFALPLKEEHKFFVWKTLIPLHKPKSLGVYFQQLSYCTMLFIEKDPKLAGVFIKGLLKYWPKTNSQKEMMFLSELEEILENTNMMEFQKVLVPLYWKIACCINSLHFQVAERTLFLLNNDRIMNLIAQNQDAVLPIIIPPLEKNARSHWNKSVLNLTLNIRKRLSEMNHELVETCIGRLDEEEMNLRSAAAKRKQGWERLENAHAIAVSVSPLMKTYTYCFVFVIYLLLGSCLINYYYCSWYL